MPDPDPGLMTIFSEALERTDPAERAAYLDGTCGDDAPLRRRVEAMLAAHVGAGRFLEPDATGMFVPGSPASPKTVRDTTSGASLRGEPATEISGPDGTPPSLADTRPPSRPAGFVPGRVIGGRYTLLEVLGEGGMGTVYRAEQTEPVRRQVALKLIRTGMDSRSVLARFDAERQALAMMDHPNIARVYDGGATDAGQPFFVMEFVQGVPITDYCDQRRLTVDARLQLFVAVCQAVQHAHQKGIIHRDLKPSNVMVAEVDGRPTPKVIDFGVAKATGSNLTDQSLGDTAAIVGTPTYMSPEQADPSSMDIDTRTDVYALGVILYELLAGSTPLDASQFKRGALLEMLRMVREVDPSTPSTKVSTAEGLPSIAANRGIDPERLKRDLRGDLDWIVMKALEKDRTRRYETANGLAADILRHLASEPVLAAPPSRSYRARKFARKHRVGVVAASLVLLTLVAGVAGTTWGLVMARRAAESERRARLDALENERKALAAAEGERRARLDAQEKKALAEANEKLASMSNLALSYAALGRNAEALELHEETLALRKAKLGPDHPHTLITAKALADALLAAGRTPEAVPLLEAASVASPKDTIAALKVAALRAWFGQEAEFAAIRRRALATAKETGDVEMAERAAKLGSILPSTDEAEIEAALALARMATRPGEAQGPNRPWNLLALGMAAYRGGDDKACDEALRAAGEANTGIPELTGTAAYYRAMSLHRRGRADEARTLATEAAATMKPLPADDKNPLAGGATHDHLILWLAYKEAKARIGFDPPTAAAKPDGK